MRSLKIILFSFFILVLHLTGCDKIKEGQYKKPALTTPPINNSGDGDTSLQFGSPLRTALLEDCSGHLCVNCPTAAELASTLKTKYGDQLIIMTVHLGKDAEPIPNNAFSYNFKTREGDILDSIWGISKQGLPQGLINRKMNGPVNYGFLFGLWSGIIDTIVKSTPKVNLAVKGLYNADDNNIKVSFGVKFLQQLTGNFNVGIFLIEDSIINAQALPGNKAKYDYLFRHTLRTSATGVFGQSLQSNIKSTYQINQTVYKQFTLSVKSDWKVKSLSVIACIIDASNSEVIQAEETHVQ